MTFQIDRILGSSAGKYDATKKNCEMFQIFTARYFALLAPLLRLWKFDKSSRKPSWARDQLLQYPLWCLRELRHKSIFCTTLCLLVSSSNVHESGVSEAECAWLGLASDEPEKIRVLLNPRATSFRSANPTFTLLLSFRRKVSSRVLLRPLRSGFVQQ